LVEKIGQLARDKIIDGITAIRDLSKEDVYIEIDCRRDTVPQVILNQLYKNTQLEVSYGIINLCIVNGAPKVLSLKDLIKHYLDFQVEVIDRRTKFLLKKAEARLEILKALLIVHDNIDEVVDNAKKSPNQQAFADWLKARFDFDDEQTKAIIGMTLGRLTGIETTKLLDEKTSVEDSIKQYNFILESREHEVDVVVSELEELKEKYGDKRRTQISTSLLSVDDEDLIPEESIVITITDKGYIKRMSLDEFRTQNRGGMGVKGMSVYNDDKVKLMVGAKTHTDILFFTDLGKVYRKRGHEINEASRQSKGIPVLNLLNLDENEKVMSIVATDDYENKYLLFTTKNGIVKRTKLEEFMRINVAGKKAIEFKEDDSLLDVKVTDGTATILIASSYGKAAIFNETDVRCMGRTAAGVRGMNTPKGSVVAVATSLEGDYTFVLSENGIGKLSIFNREEYGNIHKRGCKGVTTLKVTDKTGDLVTLKVVKGDEDIIIITNAGQTIRTSLKQFEPHGRNTQGVKVMNLKEGEKISSFTVVEPNEDDEVNEVVEESNNESE